MTGKEKGARGQNLTGVVLAGGLSSRLGHDKASVRLAHDWDLDLLAKAVTVLRSCCQQIIVVGREHPDYECYPDAIPGRGPVGGIATALEICAGACLVLSCDLPFMEAKVLERLVACRAERPDNALVTSYRQKDIGHVEALVAVYEKEALPFFQTCTAESKLKISRVVPQERQHFLEYAADEALPFFNINYPADLLVARKILQMQAVDGLLRP